MSDAYESLRARAALLGLSLLKSEGPTPVFVLGSPDDCAPVWAHSIESVNAVLEQLERKRSVINHNEAVEA